MNQRKEKMKKFCVVKSWTFSLESWRRHLVFESSSWKYFIDSFKKLLYLAIVDQKFKIFKLLFKTRVWIRIHCIWIHSTAAGNSVLSC
jgi:hypothetical protein